MPYSRFQTPILTNRKRTNNDLLAESDSNTIVSSRASRARDLLKKLKRDTFLYSYNENDNFEQDFVDVIALSAKSPLHVDYSYVDIVNNFAYPMFYSQYALLKNNNQLLGYFSWAALDAEGEQQFFDSDSILPDPNVVRAGDTLWVIDILAPYGDARATVREATRVAKSRGIDRAVFKFQRNYSDKKSRKNIWQHK